MSSSPKRVRLAPPAVLAAALGLCSVAADCQQCQPPPPPNRGNVDRVADVVLIDATDGHAYAITANPELQHLRVLDLTTGAFLVGPNRFFPLSIPAGTETRALAVAVDRGADDGAGARPDPSRVYALDSAEDVVRVVATVGEGIESPFTVVDTFATGRAPVDIAAIEDGDVTHVATVWSEDGVGFVGVHPYPGDEADALALALPEGSHPVAIVADPLGTSFVVADAALPRLHMIEQDPSGAWRIERSVDVGGPTAELAAGVVDVGDGLAPVVVSLRRDEPAAMVVRLFRAGFREDRYALLGGTALPALGVSALVPDARADDAEVTVCCRGLDEDRIAAGEATAAFAAVTTAEGQLFYLQLAAAHIDGLVLPPGRRLVRLVDDDGAAVSAPEGIDLNTDPALWVPAAGGEARRPTVNLAPVDNFGSPPFVPKVAPGTTLDLSWEGDLPNLSRLRGSFGAGPRTFTAVVDVEARDARAGDVARLIPEAALAGCPDSHRARILAVAGAVVTLAFEGDGVEPALTDAVATSCLQGAGDVRMTVEAGNAFVVEGTAGFLGRLGLVPAGGDADDVAEGALELPGVRLTVTSAAGGAPLRGSSVIVPLDPHVTAMGLNLSAAPRSDGSGGLGTAALVPTAMASATIAIPDAATEDDADVVRARRMVMTTASVDANSGLPFVFTCDEGETSTARVETFR